MTTHTSPNSTCWAIDTHVHLHPVQLSPGLLVNLCNGLIALMGEAYDRKLCFGWCLADMPSVDTLRVVLSAPFVAELASAEVQVQSDNDSVVNITSKNWSLTVIDGEQIVTEEGLELLCIGGKLLLGAPPKLRRAIDACLDQGFIPVLPWGAGKWLGRRGQYVADLVNHGTYSTELALSDNGTRPSLWPYPSILTRAEESDYAVLNGSDSLAVCNDQIRTGRAGIILDDARCRCPMSAIRDVVSGANSNFRRYGSSMTTLQFLRTQIALRRGRKK